MEDSRPDVQLSDGEICQILEQFGFKVNQDNINAVVRKKTFILSAAIRATLEGKIAPEMEAKLKGLIASFLAE